MIIKVISVIPPPKEHSISEDILTSLCTQQAGADPEVGGCVRAGAQFKRRARGQWLASTVGCGRAAVHELESNLSPSALMINLSCATLPEPPAAKLLSGRQANSPRISVLSVASGYFFFACVCPCPHQIQFYFEVWGHRHLPVKFPACVIDLRVFSVILYFVLILCLPVFF